MSYNELLERPEWQEKCSKIIQRDHYRCRRCGRVGFYNAPNFFIESDDMSIIYELTKEYRYLPYVLNLTFKELCDADFINDFFRLKEDKQEDSNGWYLVTCHSWPQCVKTTNEYYPYDLAQIYYESEPLSERLAPYSAKYEPKGADIVFHSKFYYEYLKFRLLRLETYSREGNDALPLYVFKFDKTLSDKCLISISRKLFPQKSLVISVINNNFLYYFHLDSNDLDVPGLCVHHAYYMDRLTPWEYEDDGLDTICADCNRKILQHDDTIKYAYKDKSKIIGYPPVCPICHGSGYSSEFWFHYNGVCMSCGGEGVMVNGFNDY